MYRKSSLLRMFSFLLIEIGERCSLSYKKTLIRIEKSRPNFRIDLVPFFFFFFLTLAGFETLKFEPLVYKQSIDSLFSHLSGQILNFKLVRFSSHASHRLKMYRFLCIGINVIEMVILCINFKS